MEEMMEGETEVKDKEWVWSRITGRAGRRTQNRGPTAKKDRDGRIAVVW